MIKKLGLKLITFLTLFSFLFSTVSGSYAQANLWQDRRESLKKSKQDQNDLADALQMASLPSGFSNLGEVSFNECQGTLTSRNVNAQNVQTLSSEFLKKINVNADLMQSYFVPGQTVDNLKQLSDAKFPLVIQLGDMHGVYSFQKNLEQTILTLNSLGLKNLYVEGASGNIPFIDSWAQYPNRLAVHDAAQFFLQGGYFTGSESAGLTQKNADLKLIGMEDQSLYQKQIETFKRTIAGDKATKDWLKFSDGQMRTLQQKIFNVDLQKLWQNKRRFDSNKLGLNAWIDQLNQFSAQTSQTAPNFFLFLKAAALEKQMNSSQVQNQQAALLKHLAENLPRAQWNDFLRLVLSYRMGKTSAADFTFSIKKLAKQLDIKVEKELDNYFKYSQLSEQIRAEALYEEITRIENQVFSDLAQKSKNPETVKLLELSKDFSLLEKALDFKFNSEEWREFNSRKNLLRDFSARLSLLGEKNSMPKQALLALQSALRFGELSAAREKVFARKIIDALKTQNVVAMVSGGYHSQGVEKILRESKISHITLRAKTDSKDLVNPRHPLEGFTRAPRPLEMLFQPERVSLIPPLASVSNPALQQGFENFVEASENGEGLIEGGMHIERISSEIKMSNEEIAARLGVEVSDIKEAHWNNGEMSVVYAKASHHFETFEGLEQFGIRVVEYAIQLSNDIFDPAGAQKVQEALKKMVKGNERFVSILAYMANLVTNQVLKGVLIDLSQELQGKAAQDRPSEKIQSLMIEIFHTLMRFSVPSFDNKKENLDFLGHHRELLSLVIEKMGFPIKKMKVKNRKDLGFIIGGAHVNLRFIKVPDLDPNNSVRMSWKPLENGTFEVLIPLQKNDEALVSYFTKYFKEEIEEILAYKQTLEKSGSTEQASLAADNIDRKYRKSEEKKPVQEESSVGSTNLFQTMMAANEAVSKRWRGYQQTNYARAVWGAAMGCLSLQPGSLSVAADKIIKRMEQELYPGAESGLTRTVSYFMVSMVSMASSVMVSLSNPRAVAAQITTSMETLISAVVQGLESEVLSPNLTKDEIESLRAYIGVLKPLQAGFSAIGAALYPEIALAKYLAAWASSGQSETTQLLSFMLADFITQVVLPVWNVKQNQQADLESLYKEYEYWDQQQRPFHEWATSSPSSVTLPPSLIQKAADFQSKYGWNPLGEIKSPTPPTPLLGLPNRSSVANQTETVVQKPSTDLLQNDLPELVNISGNGQVFPTVYVEPSKPFLFPGAMAQSPVLVTIPDIKYNPTSGGDVPGLPLTVEALSNFYNTYDAALKMMQLLYDGNLSAAQQVLSSLRSSGFSDFPATAYGVGGDGRLFVAEYAWKTGEAAWYLNALVQVAQSQGSSYSAADVTNAADQIISKFLLTSGSNKGLFNGQIGQTWISIEHQISMSAALINAANFLDSKGQSSKAASYRQTANNIINWITKNGSTTITANSPYQANGDFYRGVGDTIGASDVGLWAILAFKDKFSLEARQTIIQRAIDRYGVTQTVNGVDVKGISFSDYSANQGRISYEWTMFLVMALLQDGRIDDANDYLAPLLDAYPNGSLPQSSNQGYTFNPDAGGWTVYNSPAAAPQEWLQFIKKGINPFTGKSFYSQPTTTTTTTTTKTTTTKTIPITTTPTTTRATTTKATTTPTTTTTSEVKTQETTTETTFSTTKVKTITTITTTVEKTIKTPTTMEVTTTVTTEIKTTTQTTPKPDSQSFLDKYKAHLIGGIVGLVAGVLIGLIVRTVRSRRPGRVAASPANTADRVQGNLSQDQGQFNRSIRMYFPEGRELSSDKSDESDESGLSILNGSLFTQKYIDPALESLVLGAFFTGLAGLPFILIYFLAPTILDSKAIAFLLLIAYVIVGGLFWINLFSKLHGKREGLVSEKIRDLYYVSMIISVIVGVSTYLSGISINIVIIAMLASMNISHYILHQVHNLKVVDPRKQPYNHQLLRAAQKKVDETVSNSRATVEDLGYSYALSALSSKDDITRNKFESLLMSRFKTVLDDSQLKVELAPIQLRQLNSLDKSVFTLKIKTNHQDSTELLGKFKSGVVSALTQNQPLWRASRGVVNAQENALQVFDLSAMNDKAKEELLLQRLKQQLKNSTAKIVLVSKNHSVDEIRQFLKQNEISANHFEIMDTLKELSTDTIQKRYNTYKKIQIRTDDASRWVDAFAENTTVDIIQILAQGLELTIYSTDKVQKMIEEMKLIQTQA